ncbi:MAG: hypothetical protein ACRCUJ_06655 [Phocaeicola sp.]
MKAKKYFDLMRIKDSFLTDNTIAECVDFISQLKFIRNDSEKTAKAIGDFLNSKVKYQTEVLNSDGKLVTADINNPDRSLCYRYIHALHDYFYKLWNDRGDAKTIPFAYAYLKFFQKYNCMPGFHNNDGLPNTDYWDVLDAIEAEESNANMEAHKVESSIEPVQQEESNTPSSKEGGKVVIGNKACMVAPAEESKKKNRPAEEFRDIIQHEDKDKLLERLHFLIDGKSGADVGCVLLKAKLDGYLSKKVTIGAYESEFGIVGSKWSAIYKYLNDNNINALDRANQIIIFN